MTEAKHNFSELLILKVTVSIEKTYYFVFNLRMLVIIMLSVKLYFLEMGPELQKFKNINCRITKTLNSHFLGCENTFKQTFKRNCFVHYICCSIASKGPVKLIQ